MSDDDLIRRGDVLRAIWDEQRGHSAGHAAAMRAGNERERVTRGRIHDALEDLKSRIRVLAAEEPAAPTCGTCEDECGCCGSRYVVGSSDPCSSGCDCGDCNPEPTCGTCGGPFPYTRHGPCPDCREEATKPTCACICHVGTPPSPGCAICNCWKEADDDRNV